MIPDHVAKLLTRSVKSVWALELLLYMRQHAGTVWTVDQLSIELRASRSVVNGVLPILIRDGLAEESENNRYRYAAHDDLDRAVAELDRVYKERPVTIVRAIALAPDYQIQNLADAFKFRKD